MNFIYCLLILLGIYIAVLLSMKHMKNTKLTNLLFVACIFIPHLVRAAIMYLDVGFADWNFQNTLPTANVSPFMFTLAPIILILPTKIKTHLYRLTALLSLGMFFATVLGCISQALIHYRFSIGFALDYISHFALSLWGIYLVKSKQTSLGWKACLRSGSILLCVAISMLILNLIFDTAFFGLSLNGKHSIYNTVLVSSSYLSALLYFLGLSFVLLAGYGFQKLLNPKQSSQVV